MASHAGRTRSQVKVSDSVLTGLDTSPLKSARRALKNDSVEDNSLPNSSESLNCNSKRFASPDIAGNEPKRAKVSHTDVLGHGETHPRSTSNPWPSGNTPASTTLEHIYVKPRSRSVPVFLDLANPPPSPLPSTSPPKQAQLQIMPPQRPRSTPPSNLLTTKPDNIPLFAAKSTQLFTISEVPSNHQPSVQPSNNPFSMSPLTPLVATPMVKIGPATKFIPPSSFQSRWDPVSTDPSTSTLKPTRLHPTPSASGSSTGTSIPKQSQPSNVFERLQGSHTDKTTVKGKGKMKSSVSSVAATSSQKKGLIQQRLLFKPRAKGKMKAKEERPKPVSRIVEESDVDLNPLPISYTLIPEPALAPSSSAAPQPPELLDRLGHDRIIETPTSRVKSSKQNFRFASTIHDPIATASHPTTTHLSGVSVGGTPKEVEDVLPPSVKEDAFDSNKAVSCGSPALEQNRDSYTHKDPVFALTPSSPVKSSSDQHVNQPGDPPLSSVPDPTSTATHSTKMDSFAALSENRLRSKVPVSSTELRRSTRTASAKRKVDSEEPTTPPKRHKEYHGSSPAASGDTHHPTFGTAPETPRKQVSPAKTNFSRPTASSLAKFTPKSPIKSQTIPSPSKIARSASMASRPTGSFIRSFPHTSNVGSSLSDLTSALAKLKRPPPSRPSSSLGFAQPPKEDTSPQTTQDDVVLHMQPPKPGLARASTLGADMLGLASGLSQDRKRIFPVLGAPKVGPLNNHTVQKVSRAPALPSVASSPRKGDILPPSEPTLLDTPKVAPLEPNASPQLSNDHPDTLSASRKASQAFQTLAQVAGSATILPPQEQPKTRLVMGPPRTPPRRSTRHASRSASSSHPSSVGAPSNPPSGSGTAGTDPRDSVKRAKEAVPSLKILDGCVIFVDVRGEDGRDAGELFVDMLRSLGARILASVGTTCTHVVYKDGMASTISRYRLLAEPKPKVVGISWVVECAEHQSHTDETKHLVDVDDSALLAGKRRRSAIPKSSVGQSVLPGTQLSMDVDSDIGNDSIESAASFDDVTPLERARMRRMHAS